MKLGAVISPGKSAPWDSDSWAAADVLETELNERDAFKAVFSFQQTLDGLRASEVPNLDITQNGTVLTLYLRGVGTNASDPNDEASVALYVDGVYIASPLANIFDFNNVERVEVLSGPQGTLFGRNATGGVIQVITRDPSQTPQGQASVTYGDYNTVFAEDLVDW